MIPHMHTGKALVVLNREGQPFHVSLDHPDFDRIYKIVTQESITPDEEDLVWELIVPITRFKRILDFESPVDLTLSEYGELTAKVFGEDFDIPVTLADTIREIHEANGNIKPFVKFLEKLALNPRRAVVDELWSFIKVCGMTLTEDGNFLAYKNVNVDFTSIFDNKTDNTPGTCVKMLRSNVEHDPNRTCAKGLHFAAWGYLKHYAPGRKTVLLSISPEHVVSIPTDYNNMKGRASEYVVLREVEQSEELKTMRIYKK